jgi:hypothetical protein
MSITATGSAIYVEFCKIHSPRISLTEKSPHGLIRKTDVEQKKKDGRRGEERRGGKLLENCWVEDTFKIDFWMTGLQGLGTVQRYHG